MVPASLVRAFFYVGCSRFSSVVRSLPHACCPGTKMRWQLCSVGGRARIFGVEKCTVLKGAPGPTLATGGRPPGGEGGPAQIREASSVLLGPWCPDSTTARACKNGARGSADHTSGTGAVVEPRSGELARRHTLPTGFLDRARPAAPEGVPGAEEGREGPHTNDRGGDRRGKENHAGGRPQEGRG